MTQMDHVEKGAKQIADLMDRGNTFEAEERLRSDFLNMNPEDFKKLVGGVQANDKAGIGGDLRVEDKDKNGLPELSITKTGLSKDIDVVGTAAENAANFRFQPAHAGKNDFHVDVVPEQRGNLDDPIKQGAAQIARMLDGNVNRDYIRKRLAGDFQTMSEQDYRTLLKEIMKRDRAGGIDLTVADRNGDLVPEVGLVEDIGGKFVPYYPVVDFLPDQLPSDTTTPYPERTK